MKFEEYMNSKIPTWKNDLSTEVILYLKQLYENASKWEQTIDNIFDITLSPKAPNVDYSADLMKAQDKLNFYNSQLENDINNINMIINGKNNIITEQQSKTI